MQAIQNSVTFQQLMDWGASNLYEEKQIREWFGKGEEISVDQVLSAPVHPSRLFWVVIRPQILPTKFIHTMGADLCRELLNRLIEKGTYVDFRSLRVLDTVEAWLDERVSLGELTASREKAYRVMGDVAELEDNVVNIAAETVYRAANEDAVDAFKGVFYCLLQLDHSRTEQDRLRTYVRERVAAYASEQTNGRNS